MTTLNKTELEAVAVHMLREYGLEFTDMVTKLGNFKLRCLMRENKISDIDQSDVIRSIALHHGKEILKLMESEAEYLETMK